MSPGSCNVTYTAVGSDEQQTVALDSCYTIYECWLVHSNKSVCLYLESLDMLIDKPTLTLVALIVKEQKWEVTTRTRVFLQRVNTTLPFSTALYETTMGDTEIAEFLIGNQAVLSRVILYFDHTHSNHWKLRHVCKPHHRIVALTVKENLIVACDNEVVYVKLEQPQQRFNITPDELNGEMLKSGSAVKYGKQFGAIVIKNYTTPNRMNSNDIKYCFLCPLGECSQICSVIPNTLFIDGVIVEEGNSKEWFFIILNQSLAILNPSKVTPNILAANVCHSDDCYLHHSEHFLYIYEPNRTAVLDLTTYKIIVVQNTSVCNLLQHVAQYCNDQSTPAPIIVTQSLQPTSYIPHTSFIFSPSITNSDGPTMAIKPSISTVIPTRSISVTTTITSSSTQASSTVISTEATRVIVNTTSTPAVNDTSYITESSSALTKELFIIFALVAILIFLLSVIMIYCAYVKSPAKASFKAKTVVINWPSVGSLTSESGAVSPVCIPHHPQQATGSGYTNSLDEIVCLAQNSVVPVDYNQPASQCELKNTTRMQWSQYRTEPSPCRQVVLHNASESTT